MLHAPTARAKTTTMTSTMGTLTIGCSASKRHQNRITELSRGMVEMEAGPKEAYHA